MRGKVSTPAEFAEAMKKCAGKGDEEVIHSHADNLLCRVLTELGYGEGIEIFKALPKWYA